MIIGLVYCFGCGCATNPVTGEAQLMLISEQQDIEIGRKYAPEVEKQMGGRVADRLLQNYVDSVGQRLARVSHKPDWQYQFVVLENETLNAFALPGGYVFITSGMLKKLATEAQLAGMLSHEITHIAARHSSANMSREIGISILLSAVTPDETPQGVLTVADLTRQILGLGYSRQQEKEADLGGLDYMVGAAYNPYGMVETLRMLENEQKQRPIEFFSTHPAPQNRIAYLTENIRTEYRGFEELRTGEEDYRRAVLERLSN